MIVNYKNTCTCINIDVNTGIHKKIVWVYWNSNDSIKTACRFQQFFALKVFKRGFL